MGRGYIQRYRTSGGIDGPENNSKVVRHMGENITQHKRTKQNKIKRTDKGVIWCAGIVVEEFQPRGPTASLNGK